MRELTSQCRQFGQLLASGFSLSLSLHEQLSRTATALCSLADKVGTAKDHGRTPAPPSPSSHPLPPPKPAERAGATAAAPRDVPSAAMPSSSSSSVPPPPAHPPGAAPPPIGRVSSTERLAASSAQVATLLHELNTRQAALADEIHLLQRRCRGGARPLVLRVRSGGSGGSGGQREWRAARQPSARDRSASSSPSAVPLSETASPLLPRAMPSGRTARRAPWRAHHSAASTREAPNARPRGRQSPLQDEDGSHEEDAAAAARRPLPSSSADAASDGRGMAAGSSTSARLCVVCTEGEADAVFYRCGHRACCLRCAHYLRFEKQPCPMCRAPIEDVIKVYE